MDHDTKRWRIYNLIFPDYVETLELGNYTFRRVPDYREVYLKMQHKVDITGTEISVKPTTGSHQITATVETTKPEVGSVLQWAKKETQITDVLFILTLFNGRHVFCWEEAMDHGGIIVADHREFENGGDLRLSMDPEEVHDHDKNGWYLHSRWIGFEKTINRVLNTIGSEAWQKKFKGGYFLFIYRASLQRQIIESSFILCWTVWTHIYTILNPRNLSESELRVVNERDKIAFILESYFGAKVESHHLTRMVRARNRVVHFGRIPDDFDIQEMRVFVRATDFLIAKILDLNAHGFWTTPDAIAKLMA